MMPEMSRAAWFMPGTAISMSASWSKGRSRRRTPAATPRCRTTTGLLSPVPSAARGSTTRMSATISNASWQVAYLTLHYRGCTLVPPSTWAKRVPTYGERRWQGQRRHGQGQRQGQVQKPRQRPRKGQRWTWWPRGKPDKDKNQNKSGDTTILHQGGNLSSLLGSRARGLRPVPRRKLRNEQGAKRGHADGDESNPRKPFCFMRMAQKLRKKGLDVTCPAVFRQGRSGDQRTWYYGYVSVYGNENAWGYWIRGPLYLLWPRKLYLVGT